MTTPTVEKRHGKGGGPRKRPIEGDSFENSTKKKRCRPSNKSREPVCKCFRPHESLIRCQEEEKFQKLCNITSKIISISDTITVFIGTENETFSVHKDLLKLHSTLCRNHMDEFTEDGKLGLPKLKPAMFADFVSWMYNGNYLEVGNEALGVADPCTELWNMGAFLQDFKTSAWTTIEPIANNPPEEWPSIAGIELIYKLSEKGSLFRKFAAHSMSSKPPLEMHKEGSNEYNEWKEFLDRCPDLVLDMALMGKKWDGTFAWDDVHRKEYMVNEVPVDKRWEDIILSTRSKKGIKKAAQNGCWRSKIELAHLKRDKSPGECELERADIEDSPPVEQISSEWTNMGNLQGFLLKSGPRVDI